MQQMILIPSRAELEEQQVFRNSQDVVEEYMYVGRNTTLHSIYTLITTELERGNIVDTLSIWLHICHDTGADKSNMWGITPSRQRQHSKTETEKQSIENDVSQIIQNSAVNICNNVSIVFTERLTKSFFEKDKYLYQWKNNNLCWVSLFRSIQYCI